jgi:hypothetical protein
LAVLEKIVLGPSRTLRCFLSYRFTPDNEDSARKLKDFLTLLGIEVVTGTTNEPRPLSQKVMERLKDDLDFVVLLIGHDGESHWTRAVLPGSDTPKHKWGSVVALPASTATMPRRLPWTTEQARLDCFLSSLALIEADPVPGLADSTVTVELHQFAFRSNKQ